MSRNVSHANVVLAELGPVARDRGVELEEPSVQEQKQANGHETLRPREDDLERVLLPAPARVTVGGPTPEVDDELAVTHDREGSAELAAVGEIAFELLPHRLEAMCDESVRGRHR